MGSTAPKRMQVREFKSLPSHMNKFFQKSYELIFLLSLVAYVALVFAIVGCGSGPTKKAIKLNCPQATNGHGHMGVCAPPSVSAPLYTKRTVAVERGVLFPDYSNNDPCYCGAKLKRAGAVGEIDKVNQGTGFIDWTFPGLIKDAREHGLAVGGYDFVEDYTAKEAYVFIARLEAAGIYPNTPNTFPPTLDVEYGNFSYPGLEHMAAVIMRTYHRLQVYTGKWYWEPHAGCRWLGEASAWIAGYPSAPLFCGERNYRSHQFTDHGCIEKFCSDLSVYFAKSPSFAEFVGNKPKPTPVEVNKKIREHYERELKVEISHREVIRALLTKHRCRTTRPHPSSYKKTCRFWRVEGATINRNIRTIQLSISKLT